jgi:hypothetical protein
MLINCLIESFIDFYYSAFCPWGHYISYVIIP